MDIRKAREVTLTLPDDPILWFGLPLIFNESEDAPYQGAIATAWYQLLTQHHGQTMNVYDYVEAVIAALREYYGRHNIDESTLQAVSWTKIEQIYRMTKYLTVGQGGVSVAYISEFR